MNGEPRNQTQGGQLALIPESRLRSQVIPSPAAWTPEQQEVRKKYRRAPRGSTTGRGKARELRHSFARQVYEELFPGGYYVQHLLPVIRDREVALLVRVVGAAENGTVRIADGWGGARIAEKAFRPDISTSRIGDAFKGAEADAIKKILANWGMFEDVYGGSETPAPRSPIESQARQLPTTQREPRRQANGEPTKELITGLLREAINIDMPDNAPTEAQIERLAELIVEADHQGMQAQAWINTATKPLFTKTTAGITIRNLQAKLGVTEHPAPEI